MVAAAVAARIGSNRIKSIDGVAFASSRREPTLEHTSDIVSQAISRLPNPSAGTIVAERGEFYEESELTVAGFLDSPTTFKYVETIAERRVIEVAHHAAYAARTLMLSSNERVLDPDIR